MTNADLFQVVPKLLRKMELGDALPISYLPILQISVS
jgi:hypothetical protein